MNNISIILKNGEEGDIFERNGYKTFCSDSVTADDISQCTIAFVHLGNTGTKEEFKKGLKKYENEWGEDIAKKIVPISLGCRGDVYCKLARTTYYMIRYTNKEDIEKNSDIFEELKELWWEEGLNEEKAQEIKMKIENRVYYPSYLKFLNNLNVNFSRNSSSQNEKLFIISNIPIDISSISIPDSNNDVYLIQTPLLLNRDIWKYEWGEWKKIDPLSTDSIDAVALYNIWNEWIKKESLASLWFLKILDNGKVEVIKKPIKIEGTVDVIDRLMNLIESHTPVLNYLLLAFQWKNYQEVKGNGENIGRVKDFIEKAESELKKNKVLFEIIPPEYKTLFYDNISNLKNNQNLTAESIKDIIDRIYDIRQALKK